jgi:nitrogen regulatory protein PII
LKRERGLRRRSGMMRMVLVVYNSVIEPDLMESLKKSGITSYTKWTRVQGIGKTSGPHLDSEVWPATNSVLALAVEDSQKESIIKEVRGLRNGLSKEGVKAFTWSLEEVI